MIAADVSAIALDKLRANMDADPGAAQSLVTIAGSITDEDSSG